jgi:hypothetical protein
MLYKFYLLEESMTDFQDKENVCFYHSFYIYLKKYYPTIISFEEFLQFKDTNNYFTSIEDFTKDYKILHNFLISKDSKIKKILKKCVLGICNLQDDKAELHGFINLNDLLKDKLHFKSSIESKDKPIILLNHNQHFNPIMLI